MDYTTLVGLRTVDGSIRQWVNDSSIPATVILEEAEAWIYRRLRIKDMLTTASGTIAASSNPATSASSVAHPARYIASKRFELLTPTRAALTKRTADALLALQSIDTLGNYDRRTPANYASIGATFQLDSAADQDYTYRVLYYAALAPLSALNTTNALTDRAPRLVRAACLYAANEFRKNDTEKTYWLNAAEAEIKRLNAEDDFEQGGVDNFPVVP